MSGRELMNDIRVLLKFKVSTDSDLEKQSNQWCRNAATLNSFFIWGAVRALVTLCRASEFGFEILKEDDAAGEDAANERRERAVTNREGDDIDVQGELAGDSVDERELARSEHTVEQAAPVEGNVRRSSPAL
jgi:hypothetical protein